MIAQHATSENDIVITTADFDRLQCVLVSPRHRTADAALLLTLKGELGRGAIVEASEVSRSVVTMHSQVRVRDLDEDESEIYTLVYPEEADMNVGKLSVLAPLGAALLGTRAGQIVRYEAPAGSRRLKIQKILYQPEAAGDFHL